MSPVGLIISGINGAKKNENTGVLAALMPALDQTATWRQVRAMFV
jgi:hypothetical protein